ncbi:MULTISPECIES: hypothetical protein [Burkholderia]|uniref:Uncharacterized protein n=1 Tax=Burkholderia pyrrocinia TaxID=60550 RepID=A0A318J0M4_BURPY|nr:MULTISPECIES: hypothetical protein [Burkholderia]PXX41135.1 hypothetical protein NA66_1001745 [Burkholderia pyrrocinia]SFW58596.1 hypothetical protein SAMN03159384_03060 [Burkholderia sp. NFACC33-1]SFY12210.1 hypothetical protein SAMN03159408_03272 [Burkholderia sp. NFPP32]
MIDISNMKTLAAHLRDADEQCRECKMFETAQDFAMAATAIDTLLSELEAREAHRRDALPDGVQVSEYCLASGVAVIRTAQRSGPDKWKVIEGSHCLNKSGEWEYEPLPSSRTDEFLARCRFDSAQEAIDAALAQRQEGEDDERMV